MFRYSLRTLLILLAVGPMVLAGIYLAPRIPAVVALVSLLAFISWLPEHRFRRQLKSRESLDDARFFNEFYAASGISADIPRRLRPIYEMFFRIPSGKSRPHDHPPALVDVDTSDLVRSIEKEFGVTISDIDAEGIDGSFDSIVRHVGNRLAN